MESELNELQSKGAMIGEANADQWRELVIGNGYQQVRDAIVWAKTETGNRQVTAQQVATELEYTFVGLAAAHAKATKGEPITEGATVTLEGKPGWTPEQEAKYVEATAPAKRRGRPPKALVIKATLSDQQRQQIVSEIADTPKGALLTLPRGDFVLTKAELSGDLLPLLEQLIRAYADHHEIEFMPRTRRRLTKVCAQIFPEKP
jgi:hypothetical protein